MNNMISQTLNVSRYVSALIGIVWAYIEPTVPFLLLCVFAILLDCFTAWRLNRRLYYKYHKQLKKNGKAVLDGKLKSSHMFQMISDLCVVFLCVILAYHVDAILLPQLGNLHLAQYVSAIFCLVQFCSVLENESTASDAEWAKALQRVLQDKTERHLGFDINEVTKNEEEK